MAYFLQELLLAFSKTGSVQLPARHSPAQRWSVWTDKNMCFGSEFLSLISHTNSVFSISPGSASETSESLEKREGKKTRSNNNRLVVTFVSSVCENTSLLQRFCFMSVSEELENGNTTQDQKNNLGAMVITDYLLKLTGSVVFQEPHYILLDILLIDKLSQYITCLISTVAKL